MSRRTWLVLFFLITAADIFAIITGNEDLRWLTKSFIAPILIGYIAASATLIKSALYKWVIGALVFSWIGDILLMLESKGSIFFIFGLISFLIAHICYIDFFNVIRLKRQIKTNWSIIGAVAIYYFTLIIFLFPHLGALKIPVIIYGIVISSMLAIALHLRTIKFAAAGISIMLGAILFVASDTMLAINKFYAPFEYAGILILITYAFAQLMIVSGAVIYITRSSSE